MIKGFRSKYRFSLFITIVLILVVLWVTFTSPTSSKREGLVNSSSVPPSSSSLENIAGASSVIDIINKSSQSKPSPKPVMVDISPTATTTTTSLKGHGNTPNLSKCSSELYPDMETCNKQATDNCVWGSANGEPPTCFQKIAPPDLPVPIQNNNQVAPIPYTTPVVHLTLAVPTPTQPQLQPSSLPVVYPTTITPAPVVSGMMTKSMVTSSTPSPVEMKTK